MFGTTRGTVRVQTEGQIVDLVSVTASSLIIEGFIRYGEGS